MIWCVSDPARSDASDSASLDLHTSTAHTFDVNSHLVIDIRQVGDFACIATPQMASSNALATRLRRRRGLGSTYPYETSRASESYVKAATVQRAAPELSPLRIVPTHPHRNIPRNGRQTAVSSVWGPKPRVWVPTGQLEKSWP